MDKIDFTNIIFKTIHKPAMRDLILYTIELILIACLYIYFLFTRRKIEIVDKLKIDPKAKRIMVILNNYGGWHCLAIFLSFILLTYLFKLISTGMVIFFIFLLLITVLAILGMKLVEDDKDSLASKVIELLKALLKRLKCMILTKLACDNFEGYSEELEEQIEKCKLILKNSPVREGLEKSQIVTVLLLVSDKIGAIITETGKNTLEVADDIGVGKFDGNGELREAFCIIGKFLIGLFDIEWLELMFLLICMNLIIYVIISFQTSFISECFVRDPYIYLLMTYVISLMVIYGFLYSYGYIAHGRILKKTKGVTKFIVEDLLEIYIFSLAICFIFAAMMVYMSDVMFKRDANTTQFQIKAPRFMLASLLVSCALFVYILCKIASFKKYVLTKTKSIIIVVAVIVGLYLLNTIVNKLGLAKQLVDIFKAIWEAIRSLRICWPTIPYEVNILLIVIVGMLLYFAMGFVDLGMTSGTFKKGKNIGILVGVFISLLFISIIASVDNKPKK